MVEVNLIPESVRLARARRRHGRRWVTSIAVAAVILAVSAGVEWLHRAEAHELHGTSQRLYEELTAARTELRSVTAEAERVRLQIERAKALRSKRAWSGMFALIASHMPVGSWLTLVATDPAKPTAGARYAPASNRAKGAEPQQAITIDAPRKLKISGYALNAGDPHEFVRGLKSTALFTKVQLEHSQRESILNGSYFQFEVVCEW